MDRAELLVERYLKERFSSVIHEPDGNIPPDFLVDDAIAVEVRRLNQNETSTGRPRGLEESSIPLFMKVRALLANLPAWEGPGLWVSFSYRRPLPPWTELQPWIHRLLSQLPHEAFLEPAEFQFDTFRLKVPAVAERYPGRFVLTGYIDRDAGGWLLAEMKKNIELCIAEKTRKVEGVRKKYPTWWLILVEHIGAGLNEFDRQLFRDNIRIDHSWDKVLVVDSNGRGGALEV